MKKTLLIAPLALLAAACATTQTAEVPAVVAPVSAAAVITAAEEAAAKADAVGYQWRDTGTLLEEAKKAEAAQEFAKANQLAQQALRQSENALKQQAQQQDAGSRN